jgi:hypothetical protein
MKLRAAFWTAVVASLLARATTLGPFPGERLLLDRVASAAAPGQITSTIALEVLQKVALGRSHDITAQVQAELGLARGELQQNTFNDPVVRAYAFHKLGEIGVTDAIDFLENLRQEDIGSDNSQQVWPAVQVALQTALLNRISDPQLKIEFLQKALRSQLAIANSHGAVAWWTANQLCDRGDLSSTAMIQEVMKAKWSDQSGEDQIRFCEARMNVISRDSDHVKALGSVLTITNSTDDDQLISWAISQLRAMRSPNGNRELKRFATEIRMLPPGSPAQKRFERFEQEVAPAAAISDAR